METLLTTTVFSLNPGEVAPLSVHTAQRLYVEDAAGLNLWVTRDGDSEDYWVRCGASLATAMRASAVFDPMALQMTRIGEESGALDTMLLHVAQCCEREVDEGVAAVAGMVEPLIVVVLGVLIGGLVIAMYLPIFKLAQVV